MQKLACDQDPKLLVFKNGLPTFFNRYPKPATGDYKMQLQGLISFNPSPKLQSSVLFGLIFTILAATIIGCISNSKKYAKLTTLLFCGMLLLCFILLQIGAMGIDYRLSIGLAHYLEDIVLSPFIIMALIVLLKINDSVRL